MAQRNRAARGSLKPAGPEETEGRDAAVDTRSANPQPASDELAHAPTAVLPASDDDPNGAELEETVEYPIDDQSETIASPEAHGDTPSGARTAISPAGSAQTGRDTRRETRAFPAASLHPRASEPPPTRRPAEPRASASCATGPPVAVLVAIEGELAGSVFPLYDGQNSIGRAESNSVMLESMKISRQQALINHHQGAFSLHPLSEGSPVAVDDAVATQCVDLGDGAIIRVGLTIFRFRTIEPL